MPGLRLNLPDANIPATSGYVEQKEETTTVMFSMRPRWSASKYPSAVYEWVIAAYPYSTGHMSRGALSAASKIGLVQKIE